LNTGGIAVESEIAEGGVLNTGGIAGERFGTNGSVAAAGGVAKKRFNTVGRVVAAGCVVIERVKPDCRVAAAGCEVEEGISALSGVEVGIASVRWWVDRSSCRRKRKAGEREGDEKETESQRRSVH